MSTKSWEVSDAFWKIVEPLVPQPKRDKERQYKRKVGGGRKPIEARKVFSAIVYVLRTGIQWKALPKEVFGSPSAIHRYFREWEQEGFFLELWQRGLSEYDDMEGIAWEWQSIDGSMNKAPLAKESSGRNPTDRGKKRGTKRHILVDERGVPLSVVVTGANRHDVSQLKAVLDSKITEPIMESERENLCADAGYAGDGPRKTMIAAGYAPHVRPRGEEKREKEANPLFKARRWVVEACHSWFNRFRKLTIRYEKLDSTHLALTHLAAAIIALRKVRTEIIYG
ncbi:IS5 family transposase [Desulfovibrio sp. OttesenSCG-928-M14]|nr:IS5 family transposase [Desulfovibrio sp. OttesenSCG-928-M14]